MGTSRTLPVEITFLFPLRRQIYWSLFGIEESAHSLQSTVGICACSVIEFMRFHICPWCCRIKMTEMKCVHAVTSNSSRVYCPSPLRGPFCPLEYSLHPVPSQATVNAFHPPPATQKLDCTFKMFWNATGNNTPPPFRSGLFHWIYLFWSLSTF